MTILTSVSIVAAPDWTTRLVPVVIFYSVLGRNRQNNTRVTHAEVKRGHATGKALAYLIARVLVVRRVGPAHYGPGCRTPRGCSLVDRLITRVAVSEVALFCISDTTNRSVAWLQHRHADAQLNLMRQQTEESSHRRYLKSHQKVPELAPEGNRTRTRRYQNSHQKVTELAPEDSTAQQRSTTVCRTTLCIKRLLVLVNSMSRPHVWLIGTLLLLTIRSSSSSVSRRLSNDAFFQFFGSPSSSTEGLVASNHTHDISATSPQVSSANLSQSPNWGKRKLISPYVTEKNISYLEETFNSHLGINQSVTSNTPEQFRDIYIKDPNSPWHLTYNRLKRNSSQEIKITPQNSNISINLFDENNNQYEAQQMQWQVLINSTQDIIDPLRDHIYVKGSQLPTGFRIPRRRRKVSFASHNHHINNESSNTPPPFVDGGLEISVQRRYPRYQLQSQHPSAQQKSKRWPGHALSQDPNYHPINDVRFDTRPLIPTQTSFISSFQPRSQSVIQQQNSMQQYMWSLYNAQNKADQTNHGDSPSDSSSQSAGNSRYSSSRRQQVSVLTPSPSHAEAHDNKETRSNASKKVEISHSRTSQSYHDNHIKDSFQSKSDRSRTVPHGNRNVPNGVNNINELTTAASGNLAESRGRSQQSISAVENDKESDKDDDDDADNDTSSLLSDATNLRVGKSLNIFSRYGFLTLSIKVRPPVGVDNYLFMENTAEVFQKNSYWSKRERRRHTGRFDDHFYIHFCENLNELLIAYFDHFTIEGVPKAHKAFTASLSVRDLARQFGINSSFLRGRFSFVLVRLFRRKMRKTLKGPLTIQTALDTVLRSIRIGSEESVHRFVDRFGTHVIKEFEVGDMMYQTFVFGERIYKQLKNTFVTVGSESHLEQLQLYFSPRFATNVGNIQLASGNSNLTTILEGWSVIPEQILYPTIFKVFDDPAVETELEQLDGEVVLSLKLDKITTRLPLSAATMWMSEVLDNSLALYYHNLDSTRDTT
ncbi:hypothetical protein FHG87_009769 [Trinorchestia longiramus]|nr:hypothetical protein FHG87_009769 [Trinorchestia longiramus]